MVKKVSSHVADCLTNWKGVVPIVRGPLSEVTMMRISYSGVHLRVPLLVGTTQLMILLQIKVTVFCAAHEQDTSGSS